MYEALPSPPAVSSTPIIRFVACSTKSSMLHQNLSVLYKLWEIKNSPKQLTISQDLRALRCSYGSKRSCRCGRHSRHRAKRNPSIFAE
ncbi:hypothetical protein GQ600_1943 [Phytophthora cactorum]|nr:hypothetical protein GQ600_1943 [Phytophthora cactorum]